MPNDNREGNHYAGFAFMNSESMGGKDGGTKAFTGEAAIGASIYPSIQFEVVGIPKNYSAYAKSMNAQNPQLILK